MQRLSLAIAGLALVVATAHATPTFPAVIEDEVGTAGPPPCSVCHQGDHTTNYTVRTPFGAALKTRGLVPEDEASLRSALNELSRDAADSDYDGVADIAELQAGRDPNLPGDEPAGPPLEYGCAVRARGERSASAAFAAFACAVVTLWLARRRRRALAARASEGTTHDGTFHATAVRERSSLTHVARHSDAARRNEG